MGNWTKKLSGETHQIVCVEENGLVKRHIYNMPTNEQSKKDAALIASAPEMLAALKKAQEVIGNIVFITKDEMKVQAIIDNAIKSAEDNLKTNQN